MHIDSVSTRLNAPASPPSKPCHNCRRKRLRCDRSIPDCHKCFSKGEKCMGYGNLLRWTNAVAVRGNLADQTPQSRGHSRPQDVVISCDVPPRRRQTTDMRVQCLQLPLIDPLLVDLGPRHRVYIGHCESHQSGSYSAGKLKIYMSDSHPKSSVPSVKTWSPSTTKTPTTHSAPCSLWWAASITSVK